ncbi:nickel ABC transporter substrate-binding protein [Geosporobacter ferrireducens]|uniref:nickel ABC transporter substrate-binding protein n=1 Tax=Geosporobacter ferrireducens TaxID=1424294 RepID=UPI002357E4B0|nr:nickel ABC transporter substrate-binding protein [Geosporobacter ferrireducens]
MFENYRFCALKTVIYQKEEDKKHFFSNCKITLHSMDEELIVLRKNRFYLSMTALVLICALLAAGCGAPSNKPANQETEMKEEKVFTIAWQRDIGALNPHLYNSQMFAQDFIYENLLKYGKDGKIEPALAESWEISEDGKEYTFTLRKGVKFSDGSDFNAEIVKKNYDAVLKAKDNHSWLELVSQIESTEVVDLYTFKITLSNPYYPALQELTLVRPMRFLGAAGFPESGETSEEIKEPIGTGPWVLAEHKKDEYAVFVRNEHYWGTKPKIDKVIVKVIPDGDTITAAFENKEIDMIYGSGLISMDTFNHLRESGNYDTQISHPLLTRVIGLNSNKGVTNELPVRLALQYAVNKPEIIDSIFYGTEKIAHSLFAKNFPYCDINLEEREFNLEKAQQLLEEAGWKNPAGKEFKEKDGKTLEIDMCFDGANNIDKTIVQILQAQYKKAGIKLNLIGEESQSFAQRQKDGNFGMIIGETWGTPYDPHSMVASMRAPSHFDYQAQAGLPMKKEIDEKIGQVLITTDEVTRQQMYNEILGTLHDQAVYLPISYTTNIAVYHKNVEGVEFNNSYEIPLINIDKK